MSIETSSANLQSALAHARAGLPIFPAIVEFQDDGRWSKRPLVKNWRKVATTDEQQVREWWGQFPHAVPGIELSRAGIFIIDADRHGGPDGVAALEQLVARHRKQGGLPKGPVTLTAGDGRHYALRQPDGEPLGNRSGILPQGIDVRGAGGWVVAPGAERPDGRKWRSAPTTPPLAEAYRTGTIPPAPQWVIDIIRSKPEMVPTPPPSPALKFPRGVNGGCAPHEAAYARKALRRIADELRQTLANTRRNECLNGGAYRLGRMVSRGWIDKSVVVDELSAAAIASGLEVDEVQATLASGLTAGMQRPADDLQDRPQRNGHVRGGHHKESGAIEPVVWPDPVALPQSLLPVATFDYSILPAKMRPWVEDVCERMQCPPDYVGASVMAALGSLIGRKVTVRPQLNDDWSVVANQWALCIGRPGVMKTPTMEDALRQLKMLAATAREEFNLAKAEYETKAVAAKVRAKNAEKEAAKALSKNKNAVIDNLLKQRPIEDEPTLKRYIATNASVEALGVLLQQNPNGLLVHRDEMLSLLDRLDEEGHADERGFYLTGWSGNSAYTFDRIGRGLDLHVDAVCLSLLGGTQPGRISQYLVHVRRGGRGDDGLIQRFGLLVWPDIASSWTNTDRKPNREARDAAFRVFQTLDGLDWRVIGAKRDFGPTGDEVGEPFLRLTGEAHELFVAWRTELERRLRQDGLHPALESHLAKYRKLVPGLALISHLADGGIGEVSKAAVERALKWASYLETHAARAYASATVASADAARAIIAKIKSGHLKEKFGPREVWRPQWSLLTDRDTVHAALQLLADYDWLGVATVSTPGRPATVFTVNPKVLEILGQ